MDEELKSDAMMEEAIASAELAGADISDVGTPTELPDVRDNN